MARAARRSRRRWERRKEGRREKREEKAHHKKKRQMFCTKLNYTRGSQGSEIEGRAQLDEGNGQEEAAAEAGEEGGEVAAGKRIHKLE